MPNALNINNITAHLTEGGARPSQFQVIMTNPIDPSGDEMAPFMIKGAQIPSDNLGTIMIPYMGRMYPVPGDRSFEPWTTTIINDENFKVRNALESWMGAINSHRGNVALRGAPPANYMTQAVVNQMSKDGTILRSYQFNNLWPASLSAIDLAWDAVDTVEEYTVTWNYFDWKIIGGKTGNALGTTDDTVE